MILVHTNTWLSMHELMSGNLQGLCDYDHGSTNANTDFCPNVIE